MQPLNLPTGRRGLWVWLFIVTHILPFERLNLLSISGVASFLPLGGRFASEASKYGGPENGNEISFASSRPLECCRRSALAQADQNQENLRIEGPSSMNLPIEFSKLHLP